MNLNIKILASWYHHFGGHSRYPHSTWNNKFVITLQFLKIEGRDEVDFLHADKQTFLQVDISVLFSVVSHAQSIQNSKLAKSSQYLKKEGKDEVDFLCK